MTIPKNYSVLDFSDPELIIPDTPQENVFLIRDRSSGSLAHPLEFRDIKQIKTSRYSEVLTAVHNNNPVVIKQFFNNNAATIVKETQYELAYLCQTMRDGPFQVNRCLYAFPKLGMIVLSFAKGVRLDKTLGSASTRQRSEILHQSGQWLMKYGATRTQFGAFAPKLWLEDLGANTREKLLHQNDQLLMAELLENIRARAVRLKKTKIAKALLHDDFVGINLIYDNGVITGVDIQRAFRQPVAKSVARFLVWLQIFGYDSAENSNYGICDKDLVDFLGSGVLQKIELNSSLPMFIGAELYTRFRYFYDRKPTRLRAQRAIKNFLSKPIDLKLL